MTMYFTYVRFYLVVIMVSCNINTTNSQGFNLTGLEKTWNSNKSIDYKSYKNDLKELNESGFKHVRLPIDLNYYLNTNEKEKSKFKKTIRRLLSYTSRNDMSLILSNFNHGLNLENYKNQAKTVAQNWITLLNILNKKNVEFDEFYIDIINEPVLYPKEWEESAITIIKAIREVYPKITVIYGSSNYNSIYELSRMNPLPFENIIYSFHFYEPFIFTHQGTLWTGNQNTTVDIPFPYPDSTSISKMPKLSPKALMTSGEINYRDYPQTGTYQAVRDKLTLIKNWKTMHNVEVWCTEYGVSENADQQSRMNYLRAVNQVLKDFNIRGYIWEYDGNFGVKDIRNDIFK